MSAGSSGPKGPPAAYEERHLEVARTARYYILGNPSAETTEIWMVLHGFGQLARRFLRRFEGVERPHRVIVAPEALNRYYLDSSPRPHGAADAVGATWMTREDREAEIHDYVNYLDAVYRGVVAMLPADAAPRLTTLGFSQGVATAARWASLGSYPPSTIVLWAATLPPDLDLHAVAARWRVARTLLVWGSEETAKYAGGIQEMETRLREAAAPFERLSFAGGHEIDAELLAKIASGA